MKLLYIAPVDIDMNGPDGVAKKILAHVKTFSEHFETFLLFRHGENIKLLDCFSQKCEVYGKGKNRNGVLKTALSVMTALEFDCFYIRYPESDPLFIKLLKAIKKQGSCVITEIPTYPYDEEGKGSFKGRLIKAVDRFYRKKIGKYVDRIVTYSGDDTIFGIKTIKTINGFDFEKVTISSFTPNADKIHFCGVATIHPIHGFDRLIRGMANYYENGGTRELFFDVVGDGDDKVLESYRQLTKALKMEDHVIFHGRLSGDRLDAIYDLATICVNSLAIHRQKLVRESTLKTREYAAKGLPIISSSFVDALDSEDNKRYVFLIPPDESDVDVAAVLRFCDNLFAEGKIKEVKETIRKKAKSVCDMPITLAPVISFYKNYCH